jgi:hypothetical protein
VKNTLLPMHAFLDLHTYTGAASGRFLEVAPVHHSKPRGRGRASCLPAEPEAYLYGVSIDTVREVAATGKLCVMGIDEQGVAALQVGVWRGGG